jgi:CRISPR-associated endonuclease/helicase Cas3
MQNPMLAKTKGQETIREHTDKLLEQYKVLQELYPNIPFLNWDLLYDACNYHDTGKVNTKFQNKLLDKLKMKDRLHDSLPNVTEVQHGYLSVAFLPLEQLKEKYTKNRLYVLCQSIFYHHTRPLQTFDNIKKVVNEDLPQYVHLLKENGWSEVLVNDNYSKYTLKKRISPRNFSSELFHHYIMTKGLLNRIDFAASAGIPVETENEGLFEKTMNYMRNEGYKLNDLQQYLMKHQEDNNIVIASTGIGKTEGALLWIGNNKGFFTLPLKVSINAMHKRITDLIKVQNAGLLHSDTSSEYLKRADDEKQDFDVVYVEKTKQLTLPITVCTLDQLIDFVFLYPGFEMKLATLAYSKLVIDEIQMYSPDLVAFLIIGLKKLTEIGGKFTILTATFPPVLEYFMKKEEIPFKKPSQPFLKRDESGDVLVRHKVKVINNDICAKNILANKANRRVLVIVNTVKKAQQLYQEIKDSDKHRNVFLLHSRFTMSDRRQKEIEILNHGKVTCNEEAIWITTQIVEASLDIDFDVLYTELSEVCGLFQRMGRVYRGRELVSKEANVHLYLGEGFTSGINESKKSVVDFTIFQLSKDVMKTYDEAILDEETKMEIVEKVYDAKILKESGSEYYRKILNKINQFKEIPPFELEKGEIPLRDIDNQVIIPSSIFRENEEEIQDLLKIIGKKDGETVDKIRAVNRLKEYTVTIPTWAFYEAKKKHLVQQSIQLDTYTSVSIVAFKYSNETGILFELDEASYFL